MTAVTKKTQATVDDLYRVPDNRKAELVHGKLVLLMPTGRVPGYAGGESFASLSEYAKRTRLGYAFPDHVGFLVNLPNRRSFSPNAAFHPGPLQGGQFLPTPPIFAVEVRSENDYGPVAEQEIADKRADYFAAGVQVVWDVDVLRAGDIRKYAANDPAHPLVFRHGALADAEPALPGWTMPVDDLFP